MVDAMAGPLGDLVQRTGLTIVRCEPLGPLRDTLAEAAAAAIAGGHPVVVVLTDEAAPQYRARLNAAGLDVGAAEASGHIHYVDACAPGVGWAHTTAGTVFVEAPGADGILMALSEVQAELVEHAPAHLVIVDSMSTFTLLEGVREAFLLARTLKSFGDRLGASVLLGLTNGMPADHDLVPLLHLSHTVLELSKAGAVTDGRRPAPPDRR